MQFVNGVYLILVLLLHLNECDLYPVVCLNIQHLYPVSSDGEASIILGYGPGDVDFICHTVLILWSTST